MSLDDLDPYAPIFSQADAVDLTDADNATIDNWVRYKHVVPVRVGKRRLFSLLDLLVIDLTVMQTRLFRVEVAAGAYVALMMAKRIVDTLKDELADIEGGRPWDRPLGDMGDYQIGFTRDRETGELRAANPGDLEIDSVAVILPVRQIARRLLAAFINWADREA